MISHMSCLSHIRWSSYDYYGLQNKAHMFTPAQVTESRRQNSFFLQVKTTLLTATKKKHLGFLSLHGEQGWKEKKNEKGDKKKKQSYTWWGFFFVRELLIFVYIHVSWLLILVSSLTHSLHLFTVTAHLSPRLCFPP